MTTETGVGFVAEAMTMRTITRLSLPATALALTAALLPSLEHPRGAEAAPAPRYLQQCGGSSWVAGSTTLCAGVLTYRDYVHDDYGADTGDPFASSTGTLAPSAGDQRYPAEQVNTADLVALRLAVRGGRLRVSGLLNTLYDRSSTILAVAVDTDDDRTTGGGRWGALGVASRGWDKLYLFRSGDPATNTIRGSVPRPPGARWRVQAVVAQADGTVMNVAFRGVHERAGYFGAPNPGSPHPPSGQGLWWEDDQAAALAAGDISRFGHTVAVGDLTAGRTRPQAVGPGLHQRVYTSRYTLPPGEGFSYDGKPGRGDGGDVPVATQAFTTLGRYQPYGVYLPHRGGPHGMQLVFHGSSSGHAALINQPGMQRQFGEELGRVLVVPLARGTDGYGSDISERDVLDVMADVRRAYPIDPDRVFAGGYSQGGYIAFRMAMLYPDRFAGYVGWVPFTGDATNGTPAHGRVSGTAGAVGNMIDYVGNLRHVPGAMLYAGGDELVHAWSAYAMEQSFAASDSPYVWWMHPAAEHLTFAVLDRWGKEAAYTRDLRRARTPTRVTYRTDPLLDAPRYGIRHDRAYWVSAIRTAGGQGEVDLETSACGGTRPESTTASGAGPDPLPWVQRSRAVTGARPVPLYPLLSGTLTDVRTLTVDATATCLRGRPFIYALETTRPVTVRFTDGRSIRLPSASRFVGTVPS